jgi:hypothetical protein
MDICCMLFTIHVIWALVKCISRQSLLIFTAQTDRRSTLAASSVIWLRTPTLLGPLAASSSYIFMKVRIKPAPEAEPEGEVGDSVSGEEPRTWKWRVTWTVSVSPAPD